MVSSISVLNDCDLADIFLERLRFFLRLSTNEDDALLKMLFSAAVNYAEEKLAIKIGKNESGNYPDALMITIFRHVFFLYESRGISSGTSSGYASFETKEIQALYQPFILNNFNI